MKKLLTNIQIIALLIMIPATFAAYLHTEKATEEPAQTGSFVKKPRLSVLESAQIFHMIKKF